MEKDNSEIELLRAQINFLNKNEMADQVVKLSSTNRKLIDENCLLKRKVHQRKISEEIAKQNLENHMYEYRY